jgi:hypothetical protein
VIILNAQQFVIRLLKEVTPVFMASFQYAVLNVVAKLPAAWRNAGTRDVKACPGNRRLLIF